MFKALLASLLLIMIKTCSVQGTPELLSTQVVHEQADTAQINSFYQMGIFYLSHYDKKTHLDSAEVYLNKALVMARAAHRSTEINNCNWQLSNLYLARNNLPVAERYCTLLANAHEAKHETARQAETWLRFGENVLNKLTDTGKKSPESAADLAEIYFNRSIRVLESLRDTGALIEKEIHAATFYHIRGYDQRYRRKALEILKRFEKSRFRQLNVLFTDLSQVYRNEGNNNMSLFYLQKGMNRMSRIRDTVNYQVIIGELALVYDELGQTDNSIQWYKKTIALREKIPDMPPAGIYRTAGFLALNLNKRGRSAEGLRFIMGLEKRHPPKDDNVRGMAAQVKAYCYSGLKQYNLAEKYYLLMMAYYKNSNFSFLPAYGTYDIANFYVHQKKYSKAACYLKDLNHAYFNLSGERNIDLMLFKIDSAAGKPWSAIKYFQRYKQLNDSIFNVTKSGQIEELQIKYATDQKESDLISVKKDRQLQFEKAKHATNARDITFIGVGLLLIVIGLLYNSYRINEKNTVLINRKNKELNQLVDEKDGLLEEKEWLIKEVHHRVKNNLQIVMGLLKRQASYINNEEALTAIQNSEHRMHSIALIHQKLYQSDNFMLVNIADYIDEMIGYLRDSFDLGENIRFEKQVANVDFDVNVAVPLGLILNEAITNAIKYAFPNYQYGCIQVSLSQIVDNCYLLKIIDDGSGLPDNFDVQNVDSMGFSLMRGLSKQVGGVITVVNDSGVTICISFRPEEHSA